MVGNRTGKPYRLSEADGALGRIQVRRGSEVRILPQPHSCECFRSQSGQGKHVPVHEPHNCNDGFSHCAGWQFPECVRFALPLETREWTEDCWHKSYKGAQMTEAHGSPAAATNACFAAAPGSALRFVRSGNRSKMNTNMRIYRNGFRVARSLKK